MPSTKMKLPSLHLLVLVGTASVATSQNDDPPPVSINCGASQSSPSNSSSTSTFRRNVVALLDALPRRRAHGGDRAFVRGLCRGGSPPAVCLAELQMAVRNLSGSCASSRRAAVCHDKAYVAYADTNASTGAEDAFRAMVYDVGRVPDPSSFAREYEALMSRLVALAASGGKMFATGEAVYNPGDPDGTMYGLLQCMRDRSAADCEWCLLTITLESKTFITGIEGKRTQSLLL
ncbi:hypothetical protein E2562_016911 [Oryza meyeriana var. granulata]|uniref:Gnk2-homologous domain-containing protein n=1 Tax=Oryza meyeriana var. granulata TaxID=110450 RepID=A0A6G1DW77_9ORYZ|nr:hypothetical protein E2562_016911 [Oryza meyeriana var. granulata]